MIYSSKQIFLLIVFITIALIARSQYTEIGKPFIDNFSPKDYKHENQNFSIAQDTNGMMYFGNLDGVMQFDGQSWRLLEFKGKPILKSTPNGSLFVGGYQTFGEIINTENFQMKYVPLEKQLWDAGFKFDHVTKILNYGNSVLVLAEPHLFFIDSARNVEHILVSKKPIHIFGQKEPLLLLNTGLFKVDLQKLDTVSCSCSDFEDIENIIPFEENYLFKFKNNSWKIYDHDFKFVKDFSNEAKDILTNNRLVSGLYLSNGMFAFATESCGIIIVNKNGRFVTHINQNNGLLDNDIYQLFEDKHHNLWLAMNNGISLLNYPSVFTLFDRDYGIKGGILDITRFKGQLYIATAQGLYVSPNQFNFDDDCKTSNFKKIEGINLKCRRFLKTDQRLFVSNKNGIYEIIGDKVYKKSNLYAYGMTLCSHHKNIIYLATNNGLYIVDITKDFETIGKIPGLDKDVRTVVENEDGNLWIGSNYEGVYFIEIKDHLSLKAKITQYKNSNGLPMNHGWIDVFQTKKGPYFSTFKGVYTFENKSQTFVKQYLLDSLDKRWYYPISEDKNGNIWFSSGVEKAYHRQTGLRHYNAKKDSFVTITQAFNQVRDYSIEVIYPDENSVIWFGSIEGLLRFDSKKINKERIAYKTQIRMVRFGKDSIIDPNVNQSKDYIFPYQFNSVYFQVSTAYHQPQDEVLFQFKLEGLEEEWSSWQATSFEQFSGLKEGKYTFWVRSKNIDEIISETASFSFQIKPPYYRTWGAYISYLVLIFSFLFMLYRYRAYLYAKEKNELEKIIRDKTEEIVMQKERAEDLVRSILPEDTARELQTKGRASRKKYDLVTVLFSDVQGFTEIAEGLNPEKLLDEFDHYVMEFDKVVEKFGIEKIKTIGDAYMCAGGIPKKNRTNPIDVVLAGLQMIKYAKKIQIESEFDWGIRFGVHTGPVIAGVVGTKKMSYDIWGDTVNIASRMESYGEIGQLNISELTHELVEPYFDCEYRGQIPVKYKGNMKMYFVNGLKEEYAADELRVVPNRKFELKLQNIRFDDLENLILTKLEKGLDKRLYYHNVKHTIDVINQVEIIGMGEEVSEEEMIILKTAALFHDLGHTISFADHEEQGIIFAKDILPDYNYSNKQIEIISELIYATKFPPEPRNKLEEIICDADLDYLGRRDFIPNSNNLYLEMFEHGRINNKKEWNQLQVSFLKSHQYYTETARKAREVNKQEQLSVIIEQIEKEELKY